MREQINDYPLTEEQKRLVADNHNLIYGFANKKNLDVEEYYDVLAIGLCKAARIFDSSKGCQFSTVAYTCMNNEIKQVWRMETTSSRIPTDCVISYNKRVRTSEDNESVELINVISQRLKSNFDTSRADISEFFNTLSETQKFVLNRVVVGYRENEIADYLGISQAQVSRYKKRIGQLWCKFSGEYSSR